MLLEALLVLLLAVRVIMESVNVLGLEAMRVIDQTFGGHKHAYRIRDSACRGSNCF